MPLFNIIITKEDTDGAVLSGCCPFDFGSVMGQEDLYREDPPGTRVENTLQARIVWGTTVPATSRVIWGVEDDEGFPNDTGVVATGNTFHEVFFTVSQVNTTYKFQIITTSTECDAAGESLQSGTFYFEVGGDVVIGTDSFEMVITLTAENYFGLSYTVEDGVYGEYEDVYEDVESVMEHEFGFTITARGVDYEEAANLGNSELFTNYSTLVS